MFVQIECPLCGEFNQVCMCGVFEVKGYKCNGCGSKLDIIAISANNLPEVHESLELEEDETEEEFCASS